MRLNNATRPEANAHVCSASSGATMTAKVVVLQGKYAQKPGDCTYAGNWRFASTHQDRICPFSYTRSAWHPSCQGYSMVLQCHSELEPLSLDPAVCSPVFSGYSAYEHRKLAPEILSLPPNTSATPRGATSGQSATWSGFFTMKAKDQIYHIKENFTLHFERPSPETEAADAEAPPSSSVKVVGVGNNQYGKFTLNGHLDETTGELVLKKKYVPIRRPRKKPAEGARARIVVPSTSDEPGEERRASKRARVASKVRRLLLEGPCTP